GYPAVLDYRTRGVEEGPEYVGDVHAGSALEVDVLDARGPVAGVFARAPLPRHEADDLLASQILRELVPQVVAERQEVGVCRPDSVVGIAGDRDVGRIPALILARAQLSLAHLYYSVDHLHGKAARRHVEGVGLVGGGVVDLHAALVEVLDQVLTT